MYIFGEMKCSLFSHENNCASSLGHCELDTWEQLLKKLLVLFNFWRLSVFKLKKRFGQLNETQKRVYPFRRPRLKRWLLSFTSTLLPNAWSVFPDLGSGLCPFNRLFKEFVLKMTVLKLFTYVIMSGWSWVVVVKVTRSQGRVHKVKVTRTSTNRMFHQSSHYHTDTLLLHHLRHIHRRLNIAADCICLLFYHRKCLPSPHHKDI